MLTDISTSLEFSKKEKLFTELKKYIGTSTKVLVAVSSGVDSMLVSCVLYNFFVEEKLSLDNLLFVHFNHGVRKESEDEEVFVKSFFGKMCTNPSLLGGCVTNPSLLLPFTGKRESVKTKKTEENMRNWRYGQFDKICEEKKIDFVVTGHHLNDRVESSFLHMLRGAGLQGFLSMQFCENHHLLSSAKMLRPLLSLSKGEILHITEKYKIPHMQDESNFDPKISKRNKLRNVVLPQLFELAHKNTETENSFLDSMQNVYTAIESDNIEFGKVPETLACDLKDIELSPHRNAEWGYRLECLVDELKINYLLDILKYLNVSQNVTKKNLSEIVKFLNKNNSGHKFLNGVTFFVAHGEKYIIKAERHFWETFVEGSLSSSPSPLSSKLERGDFPENAIIRYPKVGDRYKGKTRNQFCVREKIPVFWRKFVQVVVVDGEIVEYDWDFEV